MNCTHTNYTEQEKRDGLCILCWKERCERAENGVKSTSPSFTTEYQHRIKSTPNLIPLGPEDVPPGSVTRFPTWDKYSWATILAVNDMGVAYGTHGYVVDWKYMQANDAEISRDCGKTWSRCEKEMV